MDARWKGAAFEGDRASLARLAAAGAKVVRVYRQSDAWVLDEAHRLGLKVVMGLWLEHPRHGFDYADARAVRALGRRRARLRRPPPPPPCPARLGRGQRDRDRRRRPAAAVARGGSADRAHPRALDPDHPTMMVVADTGMDAFRALAGCCPNVRLLGINVYAGAVFDLPQRLRAAGIAKPVVVAELGPLGQWQAGRKPWARRSSSPAPRRRASSPRPSPSSTSRRRSAASSFLWGAKQEQTATWHGLLLADGSPPTAMSDALAAAWGRPAAPARAAHPRHRHRRGRVRRRRGDLRRHRRGRPRRQRARRRVGHCRGHRPAQGRRCRDPPTRIDDARAARRCRQRELRRPGAARRLPPFITVRDRETRQGTANLPFRVR